jgi:hypothetical protein
MKKINIYFFCNVYAFIWRRIQTDSLWYYAAQRELHKKAITLLIMHANLYTTTNYIYN